MSKKKKAEKVEVGADTKEVTVADLKTIIASLNVFLKKKKLPLCVSGKNKTTASNNFEACIEGLEEEVASELPASVIEFYNANFAEDVVEEEVVAEEVVAEEVVEEEKSAKKGGKKAKAEKPKAEKPKVEKVKKEKGESNEAMTVRLIKDGKTDEEIVSIFIKKYASLGNEDKDFALKRANKYINQEKKKMIVMKYRVPAGLPQGLPEKPKKAKAEKAPAEEAAPEKPKKSGKKKKGKK